MSEREDAGPGDAEGLFVGPEAIPPHWPVWDTQVDAVAPQIHINQSRMPDQMIRPHMREQRTGSGVGSVLSDTLPLSQPISPGMPQFRIWGHENDDDSRRSAVLSSPNPSSSSSFHSSRGETPAQNSPRLPPLHYANSEQKPAISPPNEPNSGWNSFSRPADHQNVAPAQPAHGLQEIWSDESTPQPPYPGDTPFNAHPNPIMPKSSSVSQLQSAPQIPILPTSHTEQSQDARDYHKGLREYPSDPREPYYDPRSIPRQPQMPVYYQPQHTPQYLDETSESLAVAGMIAQQQQEFMQRVAVQSAQMNDTIWKQALAEQLEVMQRDPLGAGPDGGHGVIPPPYPTYPEALAAMNMTPPPPSTTPPPWVNRVPPGMSAYHPRAAAAAAAAALLYNQPVPAPPLAYPYVSDMMASAILGRQQAAQAAILAAMTGISGDPYSTQSSVQASAGPTPSTHTPAPPTPQRQSGILSGLQNLSIGPTGAPRPMRTSNDNIQYQIVHESLTTGVDTRTTLMIRNIPNKYLQKMVLAVINENFKGKYDFFYLPIDFRNKCNVGYAFINFIDVDTVGRFYNEFNKRKWDKFNSEKVCAVCYARIQGKSQLISHFQNSSLMIEDQRCRPLLFYSDGPNQGQVEPFPVGENVRVKRGMSLHRGGSSNVEAEDSE